MADENIPLVQKMLGESAEVRLLPGRAIARQHLLDADVLLVRSVTRVDAALLQGTPVRYVGSATSGVDHVKLEDLDKLGIEFASAAGSNARAVVEYVVAVLASTGRDFDGLRLGIVGCGQVGGSLYRLFKSLGSEVCCYDPFLSKDQVEDLTTLEQVLDCDVVSLHTPLTYQGSFPTFGMIGAHQLQKLRQSAMIINAGRGGVIDEEALLEFASQRPDIEVVLDVWEEEPLVGRSLSGICRYITPHIAGYSDLAKKRGAQMVLRSMPGAVFTEELAAPELSRELTAPRWQDAVLAVFDPRQATAKTLELVGDESGFDLLRKSFGSRLEFSQVGVSSGAEQRSILSKLGFVAL